MEKIQESPALYGEAALREASRFFMKEGNVFKALEKISKRLEDLQIPYAIVGGMALTAHGHFRTTEDVDILVTAESLKSIHEKLEGLGYVRPFSGSKNLKDVETNTKIEFLITGGFPGDGKPKPVAFPDPATCSIEIDGHKYIQLETLIELKLSSGMTGGSERGKDFSDVFALVEKWNLRPEFATKLNPYVRDRFLGICSEVEAKKSKPEI